MRERTIPVPLVLAAASAMVSVGVVAVLVARAPTDPTQDPSSPVKMDTGTPERTAESFLDAWRKRAHDEALSISTGAAAKAVRDRQAEDNSLSEEQYAIKEQLWDPMAQNRLAFQIEQSDTLDDGHLTLRGVADGTFLGEPYRRRVSFVLERDENRWLVSEMTLGEILTAPPRVIEQAGTQ